VFVRFALRCYAIEQSAHWHEPAVSFAQARHQIRKARIEPLIFHEAVAEMRIHNARAALFFQAILVRLREHADIAFYVGNHPRRNTSCGNEIAAIFDALLAKVAPKVRLTLDFPAEAIIVLAQGGCAIERAGPSRPSVALLSRRWRPGCSLHSAGADLVVTNQTHGWRSGFRRCGFLASKSNYLLAMSPTLAQDVAGGARNHIHVTRGDGDGRIHL